MGHFLNAQSSIAHYELPCGYLAPDGELITRITVSELSGEDEEIMQSKGSVGSRMTAVMANCLVKVGDIDTKGKASYVNALTALDRIYLLLAIRRVTFGDKYTFGSVCPHCGIESRWTQDLTKLDIRAMEDPRRRSYDVTVRGDAFSCEVMTGLGDVWIERAIELFGQGAASTLAVMVRIAAVNGKPIPKDLKAAGQEKRDLMSVYAEIRSLPMPVLQELRESFGRAEGDIDLSLELECGTGEQVTMNRVPCGGKWQTQLDLGAGFFRRSAT